MLEARPSKRILADTEAEMVLSVSRYFYETVVARNPSRVDPAMFQRVKTMVKRTPVEAWIHVPGMPLARAPHPALRKLRRT